MISSLRCSNTQSMGEINNSNSRYFLNQSILLQFIPTFDSSEVIIPHPMQRLKTLEFPKKSLRIHPSTMINLLDHEEAPYREIEVRNKYHFDVGIITTKVIQIDTRRNRSFDEFFKRNSYNNCIDSKKNNENSMSK